MKKQSNLKELLDYAGRLKYLTYFSLVLSSLSSILALFPYIFLFRIIKELVETAPNFSQAAHLVQNGWMAVLFSVLAILVYFAALMCSHLSAFRIAANIRKALMAHLSKLPIGFISEMGSGKVRRIVNDSSAATETYLAHQLPDLTAAVTTAVIMIIMLFLFDWRFGLVSLLPIFLGFACMLKMAGPSMANDMKNYMDALENMNNEAVEYIRGIPVVKTFGQTVHSFARFKETIDHYYQYCIGYCKKCRAPMLAYTVLINSAFAFLTTLVLILTGDGPVTGPILLNFLFYVIFTPVITSAMSKVMMMAENTMAVSDALSRIDALLEAKPLSISAKPCMPSDHSVTLSHVSFRYTDHAEDALKDVSISVQEGETLALVGPSGSGKTTAAGLISRFWDPDNGMIQIGGVNLKDLPGDVLTDQLAYVFLDSRLLKTSILENVRLARPNASREEVRCTLHDAQCDDILEKLPDGMDTVIGSKGIYLSGGEQQRIAIARAILKNAPILILDEATAFADPENEMLVQRAFAALSKGKTVILIAHRLTTVKDADQIVVLQEGCVQETGTHDSLLKKDGLYAAMWQDYQKSVSWKVGEKK